MKTVGDFKKAGLVFVNGDKCVGSSGNVYGHPYGWVLHTNSGSRAWIDDHVKEFAWRENTGEQPEFDGVVEVELAGGVWYSTEITSDWDWDPEDTHYKIIRWRPVLDKAEEMPVETPEEKARLDADGAHKTFVDFDNCTVQEIFGAAKSSKQSLGRMLRGPIVTPSKPTYTPEAHAAGELPPIGSTVYTVHGTGEVATGEDSLNNVIVKIGGRFNLLHVAEIWPPKTHKDVVVGKAFELSGRGWVSTRAALEKLYDAGMLKD